MFARSFTCMTNILPFCTTRSFSLIYDFFDFLRTLIFVSDRHYFHCQDFLLTELTYFERNFLREHQRMNSCGSVFVGCIGKKKHLAFVERCFEAGKCWLVTNVRIRAICYTICARENKCLVFWKRHKQERSHARIFPPFLDKKGETFCCFSVWLQSDLYNDQFINRERNEEAY